MRIIKLSSEDPDPARNMKTLDDALKFFNEELAQRTPKGKFFYPKGKIRPDGLKAGETLVFTYDAKIIYIAKAQTPPEVQGGKAFFCVDMDTLVRANGRALSKLGSDLKEYNPKFTVGGRGWNSIAISEEEAREVLSGYTDEPSASIYDQFKAILDDETIPDTQKEQLINARLGQGQFRDGVIKLHGKCVVTGVQTRDLLIASHIKPWQKCDNNAERLDPHNGLLLVATYDRLFDKGYITFNAEGELRLSAALSKRDREILDIKHVRINLSDKARVYMQYHRDIIFKNLP